MNERTFRPLKFEILLAHPLYEGVALHFVRNLERLGIEVTVTTVDPVLYARRLATSDFDMVVDRVGQSLAPGMDQREYWGSAEAYMDGSRNIAGVRDTLCGHPHRQDDHRPHLGQPGTTGADPRPGAVVGALCDSPLVRYPASCGLLAQAGPSRDAARIRSGLLNLVDRAGSSAHCLRRSIG